ncbi:MAG: hypothetical protein NTX22_09800 [Ignavibacteriales bacterium]|nr:hypothetical protein [Ignavibacteriales bacterium]
MKKYISITLSTFVLILLLGTKVFAISKTTSQSGNWSASSTWGGNPSPVAGDDIIIDGGFTVTVDIPDAVCLSIQLGGSALGLGTGTLLFTGGSQVTVSGAVSIGPFNNNNTAGSVIMSNGGTLICEGFIVGRLGTWTPGTGTIELTATNTIPNNNNIIFNNLTISSGITTLSHNVDVNGNLLINTSATLNGGANTLTVGGDWTNDGSYAGNTGTVTFKKTGNPTISGTGINNFNLIRVNLGTSINNTLEVLSSHFNAPDGFLTLTNGTFKMSGTFTFTNTFLVGPSYNIQPTSGLWINNPNVTVVAQAGGISLRGLLRISAGTYNIGTGIDNSLTYVTGSSIIIEGGSLHIAGRLNGNNSTATTTYNQSDGVVSVVEQGSTDPVFAGFDLSVVGSSFTMAGGNIILRNATSAPTDYLNNSSVAIVTGGTLQIGDAGSLNAQVIRIQSPRPIGNLLVFNATAQLVSSSISVVNNVTVQTGRTLNANGFNISLGGDWFNIGTFIAGGNTVTFNGSVAQTLTNPSGEQLNNLTINKTADTLTLKNSITVNNTFNLAQGTIEVGNHTLTLNNTVNGAGTLISAGIGIVNYNQGSPGQNILAANYGNLVFSNFIKTLAPSGIISISGTFTPGSLSGHTVTGSTLNFNGSSQDIPAFIYNNLIISGSGINTGSGTITVGGNLTINSGVTFSGTSTLNLNGSVHTNDGTLITSTLSVGPGAVFTNNGTTSVSLALNGAGTLTQGSAGILNIGGTVGINTLNASSSGSSINYTGNGQTIVPVVYYNLTLSGSGTPILTGLNTIIGNFTLLGSVTPVAATGITMGGNFSINSGTSFDAGSFSHSLAGNFNSSGTFIAGTSTFTLSGTSAQTISGSTFYNLSIANSSGVTITSDETVNNTLSLVNGSISIGAHTLNLNGSLSFGTGSLVGGSSSNIAIGGSGTSTILPTITLNNLSLNRSSGSSLTGDITINGNLTIANGTLTTNDHIITLAQSGILSEVAGQPVIGNISTTRNITATSGIESFGNIGADIVLNGIALGNTTVLRKTGITSTGNGHNSIKRSFEIVPATNTGLNAGLIFHFDSTELNGQNSSALELYMSRDNGTTWNNNGGTVDLLLNAISITGVNDFSHWTASDTTNRIGNTPTPATFSINPAAATIGDPGFSITVNGVNFVNGKSVIRFNSNNKTTTFISSTQLVASIPTSDLQIAGTFPVTVFNIDGGGLSNLQPFTVASLPPTKISVETLADGSGIIVPPQALPSGSSITVYAISRDALNHFVANVAADEWALENISGGVVLSDLVPSPDKKNAVLSGHLIGAATIKSTSGPLVTIPSGTVTVTQGTVAKIRVETAADGSGVVVPADTLISGSSITVYSIARDSFDNFIENVAADAWSLENINGGIVASDLVAAINGRSAEFNSHSSGSANIKATSGALTIITSGTISVVQPTGIEKGEQPISFALMQNYPNPFNPSTTIKYALPNESKVVLYIYNIFGEQVAELVNEIQPAGYYNKKWSAENLSSGIYLVRINAKAIGKEENYNKIIKMQLVK